MRRDRAVLRPATLGNHGLTEEQKIDVWSDLSNRRSDVIEVTSASQNKIKEHQAVAILVIMAFLS